MTEPSSNLTVAEALAILRHKGRIVGGESQIHGERTTDIDGVPRTHAEVLQMAEMEQGRLRREA